MRNWSPPRDRSRARFTLSNISLLLKTPVAVNRDTIYKWIERKKMPAHKVGRLWKFLGSEVDQWVKQGKAAQ
jgi:excisionase family DNA binding protein